MSTFMGNPSTSTDGHSRYLVPYSQPRRCYPTPQSICIYPYRDRKYPCLNKCTNWNPQDKFAESSQSHRSSHRKDSQRFCRHPMSRPRSERCHKLWAKVNHPHCRGAIRALSCLNRFRVHCRIALFLCFHNSYIRKQRRRILHCKGILLWNGHIRPYWSTQLPRHELHHLRRDIQTIPSPTFVL